MTTYTQEQLNAMTPDQLKVAILEMQAQGAIVVTAEEQPVDQSISQLAKIRATLDTLKAQGAELFADEIASLEQKIITLETEAKAEVEQIGAELVAVEQTFVQKYGQAIAHGIEIILLVVIAGKLLGVM